MAMLALEATTEVCSVAVWNDGKIQAEIFDNSRQQGGNLLLAMTSSVLEQSQMSWPDIDHIAFAHGPGSFTGVRVVTGLVQGLALGRNLPVIGVSTLATLANEFFQSADILEKSGHIQVLCAQDARMDEIYWGTYSRGEDGRIESVQADQLSRAEDILLPRSHHWPAVGTASRYAGEIAKANPEVNIRWRDDICPKASSVAKLAADMLASDHSLSTAENTRPVYLRNEVTHKAN